MNKKKTSITKPRSKTVTRAKITKPVSKKTVRTATRARVKTPVLKIPASLPFDHNQNMVFDGLSSTPAILDAEIKQLQRTFHEQSPIDVVRMTELIEQQMLTNSTARRALAYMCTNAFLQLYRHPIRWTPLMSPVPIRDRCRKVCEVFLKTLRRKVTAGISAIRGCFGKQA